MRFNRKATFLIITIVASTVSMRTVNNMFVTTLPLFGKYILNFSSAEVGFLSSMAFITTLISTSMINPRLNSRVRRITYITSSLLIMLVLLMVYYSNFLTVWIFSVLAGFLYGLITPNIITSASLVDDRKLAERLLAIYSLSLSMSLVLGPVLETYLLRYYDYRSIFLLFIPLAAPLFIFSFSTRFPEEENERFSFRDINRKVLFAAVINVMIYNIPFSIITVYASIYTMETLHVSRWLSYFVYVPFFTVSFFTRLAMAIRPIDDLRFTITLSAFLTAIGILMLSFPINIYFVFVSMALLGIPHGTIFPISIIMISRGTDLRERNSVNSYFIASGNILMIVFPPFYGLLFTYFGYGVMIATLVIPVVIFYILLRKWYYGEKFMHSR
ncbi:MAG: MFS transporter [Thermoplasmata archaeon]